MPRYRELKNNYTSGELDPRMVGRADNKHYINGAEYMRNVIALPQGGWKLRPGLAHVAEVPDAGGGAPSDTRLISHVFNASQRYLLMLVDEGYQVFKGGVLVADETGEAWGEDDLGNIAWTQSRDTLLIFHDDYRPRAIQRQGDDVTWNTFDWTLNNIPRFAFGDTVYVNGVDEVQTINFTGASWVAGDPFTLTVGGEETDPIAYHATPANLATNIETALRALSFTSATGITAAGSGAIDVAVTFGGDEGDRPWGAIVPVIKATSAGVARFINVTMTTKGVYPGEDTWSTTRGWPCCGAFFQGRLIMAGSRERPDTAWGSRAGDEEDFNIETPAEDYAFEATANADEVPKITQVFAGRHLQFFSSSAEFYVPPTDADKLTPNNFALRATTARGIKAGLPVFDIEGATVFVQAEKDSDADGYRRGVSLREFIYADGEQAYQANNISLLASHLIRDPRRIAVKRTATTNDCDYVVFPNEEDGSMTWFATLRTQEINAYSLAETEGTFLDVGVDGDDIYAVVERSIDGVTRRFLERHVEGLYVDSCAYEFDLVAPVANVTCAWLVGETVQVRVDGNWRDDVVVPVGGLVEFDPPAERDYQVGLAWPVVDEATGFTYYVGDLPIAAELADGPITGRKRRTVEVVVDLLETKTLLVNGNRITGRRFGAELLDQEVPAITGEKRVRGMLGWNNRGRVTYGDTRAGPVTVRAVTKAVGV